MTIDEKLKEFFAQEIDTFSYWDDRHQQALVDRFKVMVIESIPTEMKDSPITYALGPIFADSKAMKQGIFKGHNDCRQEMIEKWSTKETK